MVQGSVSHCKAGGGRWPDWTRAQLLDAAVETESCWGKKAFRRLSGKQDTHEGYLL